MQAKIQLYQDLSNKLKELEELADHEGLVAEVVSEVTDFCNKRTKTLEGAPEKPKKAVQPREPQSKGPFQPPQKKEPVAFLDDPRVKQHHDPVRFITTYKDWIGKKANLQDAHGNIVKVDILGAAYPMLKISINGMESNCEPEKLTLIK